MWYIFLIWALITYIHSEQGYIIYKYVYRCEANVKNTMCSPFQGESTHVLCSLKDYIIVTYWIHTDPQNILK